VPAGVRVGVPSVFPWQRRVQSGPRPNEPVTEVSLVAREQRPRHDRERELVDRLDLVADANDAARDDVGAEAAAVNEWA